MKQNGFWKGFGSGLVLTVLIAALCVTATATSKRSIQVEDGIGITLNGARFTPRDAAGKQVPVFLYNGTTYVPVRAISEAMGMDEMCIRDSTCNAHMTAPMIGQFCCLDHAGDALMKSAFERMGLTARSHDRILRVARTIADLDGAADIRPEHLAEAIQFRNTDILKG